MGSGSKIAILCSEEINISLQWIEIGCTTVLNSTMNLLYGLSDQITLMPLQWCCCCRWSERTGIWVLHCLSPTDNYWNAASFTTPSSYLHFATFQGETSADISFYFKTSAPYGVFLENLGNTDFIRLELKCKTPHYEPPPTHKVKTLPSFWWGSTHVHKPTQAGTSHRHTAVLIIVPCSSVGN